MTEILAEKLAILGPGSVVGELSMIDGRMKSRFRKWFCAARLSSGMPPRYFVVSMPRAENVDVPRNLLQLLETLNRQRRLGDQPMQHVETFARHFAECSDCTFQVFAFASGRVFKFFGIGAALRDAHDSGIFLFGQSKHRCFGPATNTVLLPEPEPRALR